MDPRTGRAVRLLPVGLFLGALAFILFLSPVNDPDVFWHLKSGEWIWQHRSIPTEDPFAYTTPKPPGIPQRYTLAYCWLSQVLLHLAWSAAGGWGGIVLLRFLLAGLLLWGVVRRGEGTVPALAGLVILYTVILGKYPLERPHILSLVFLPWLLIVIDGVRRRPAATGIPWPALVGLPLLMMVWSNCHAGYILGLGVVGVTIVVEGCKYLHPALRPLPAGRYGYLTAAGLLGLLASLANPNGWHAVDVLAAAGRAAATNLEFQSSIHIFSLFRESYLIIYWALFILALATLAADWRQADLTETTLIVLFGWFSFTTIRYIPFFPVLAIPVIGRSLSRSRGRRTAAIFLLAAAVAYASATVWEEQGNLGKLRTGGWVNSFLFPVGAADFIQEENLQGNMYNHFSWGGYLIWRLGPERQVFIDGRIMNSDAYQEAIDVEMADPGPGSPAGPTWRVILDRRRVDYLATPFYALHGEVFPIIGALLRDSRWAPVFLQVNSCVFLRRSPENAATVDRFEIPRGKFVASLLEICDSLIAAKPSNPIPHLTKGDLLLKLAHYDEARQELERVLLLSPLHPVALRKLEAVRRKQADSGTPAATTSIPAAK